MDQTTIESCHSLSRTLQPVVSEATGLPIGISVHNAPGFITLDSASFHKIPIVLEMLRIYNIKPLIIPGGCISLILILDVTDNCSFNDFLKEVRNDELFQLVYLKGEGILAVWN